jgi:hypothetical protein
MTFTFLEGIVVGGGLFLAFGFAWTHGYKKGRHDQKLIDDGEEEDDGGV